MKFILFFTFIITICKGGIWIGFGVLIRNHFDTILSMIIRKPLPDGLIPSMNNEKIQKVIKLIGLLIIAIGISTIILGLSTMIAGHNMSNNFNFKF